ncbi:phosphotransferase family protein [Nocardioides sambongensis]|uniref:phosphotransferase family protein n=1 Tax=Nocardioides sambongensis TaxID=2589074 RepID=UPI0018C8A441|nr:phosphotransferase family protein [Nocardioides sambongensis]
MQPIDTDHLLDRATAAARRRTPDAELRGLRRLEGGVSSLTFASTLVGDREDKPIVLKVAPAGLAPVRNRDVLRQVQALRAVGRLPGFPVPDVLFSDNGNPPEEPPLFAMTLCPGESYEPLLDVSDNPPDASTVAERARAATRALARLQALTPHALGLGGEPVAAVDDELERWRRLFETVDPDIAPGQEKLHARLVERVPRSLAPRLLHGDYRLANMLFEGPELAAVIDWEIWSVGDPRSDLAWMLMHLEPATFSTRNVRPPTGKLGPCYRAVMTSCRSMPPCGEQQEPTSGPWRRWGRTSPGSSGSATTRRPRPSP